MNYYSKRYRNLVDAEEIEFETCNKCHRYLEDDEDECVGCEHGEEAKRLSGKWTLTKIIPQEKRTRLYLKQDDQSLCYVLFDGDDELSKFKVNCEYELTGWQKVSSRHNIITFI